MDLRQLRTFVSLAELGSLSRVSNKLRIAQPALSRQIKLLEEEIGLRLFVRHSRGMELTPSGAELLQRSAGPLRQLELSVREVRELGSKVAGPVSIGLLPSVSGILAGRVAQAVAEMFPDVLLRIAEGNARHLTEWLERGEIDAIVAYDMPPEAKLRSRDLLEEDLLLIGPMEGRGEIGDAVDFSFLARHGLVLPSSPNGLRLLVEDAAAGAGIALHVRVEADSYVALKHLVSVGVAYTVLPAAAVACDIAAGRLHAAPINNPSLSRRLYLIEAQSRTTSKAVGAAIDQLLRQVASLVRSGDWPARAGAALTPYLR